MEETDLSLTVGAVEGSHDHELLALGVVLLLEVDSALLDKLVQRRMNLYKSWRFTSAQSEEQKRGDEESEAGEGERREERLVGE